MSGNITLQDTFVDYAWLCEEELKEQLDVTRRAKYFAAVEPILDAS